MKITVGPLMKRYADCFGLSVDEVLDWVNGYVNTPEDEFPEQYAADMTEKTEKERLDSIRGYMESRMCDTAGYRMKEVA